MQRYTLCNLLAVSNTGNKSTDRITPVAIIVTAFETHFEEGYSWCSPRICQQEGCLCCGLRQRDDSIKAPYTLSAGSTSTCYAGRNQSQQYVVSERHTKFKPVVIDLISGVGRAMGI